MKWIKKWRQRSLFYRTRIRLTILNALMLTVFISALSTVVYFYIQRNVYKEVDESLNRSVQDLAQPSKFQRGLSIGPNGFIVRGGMASDPQTTTLFWNSNGELAFYPQGVDFFDTYQKELRPQKTGEIEMKRVSGYSFRSIATPVEINDETYVVEFLKTVDSEDQILSSLMIILIIGCIAGGLAAISAGFYLSGRSLVPIRAAWKKQQQFVSDASHELRTPLTVIQTRTDLLFSSPDATIEEKAQDISVISKETRRLSKLVTSLLTLARSDSNQIEIKKQPFSLSDQLKEIYEMYSDLALFQEKTLSLQIPDDVILNGDAERIHQLFVILLDNALKFTDTGGQIDVHYSETSSNHIIKVIDNGVGISEEHRSKIFDRFFQGDKSRTDQEGAGLGLSIAQWIVDKHGGKIKVDSEPGKGTTFTVILPK